MTAREGMSVDEALFYADAWGAQEDSLGHSDLAFKALAAEVRRLRSPAPAFDMERSQPLAVPEAAVEAVARKMAINIRHDPDGWGMTVDGVRFKIWEVLRDRAHEMIAIVCQHLQPDMEALRRDAMRYRWLRGNGMGFTHDDVHRGISCSRWGDWHYDTEEGFAAQTDAAIDASSQRSMLGRVGDGKEI